VKVVDQKQVSTSRLLIRKRVSENGYETKPEQKHGSRLVLKRKIDRKALHGFA
jgi:hypothetical protein